MLLLLNLLFLLMLLLLLLLFSFLLLLLLFLLLLLQLRLLFFFVGGGVFIAVVSASSSSCSSYGHCLLQPMLYILRIIECCFTCSGSSTILESYDLEKFDPLRFCNRVLPGGAATRRGVELWGNLIVHSSNILLTVFPSNLFDTCILQGIHRHR